MPRYISILFALPLLKPFIKGIWTIVCLFFMWLWSDDFYTAYRTPEIYNFGEECPGDLWCTQESYLFFSAILVVWFFCGLILCLVQHRKGILKYGIVAHIIATFMYIIVLNAFFLN